jgi:curved DNA-binding protein CbpA
MSKEEYKKYFEILEISPEASLLEIKNAYIRLKKLYSNRSVIITPIADEFPKRKRLEILELIEDAYAKLQSLFQDEHHKSLANEQSMSQEERKKAVISFNGEVLKQIRERMGVKLFEIALDTKIRVEILECIESERFEDLPPEVYLKGHVVNYANYLFLDPKKVADDYIKRYREWKSKLEDKG